MKKRSVRSAIAKNSRYELLGGVVAAASAFLIISIFLGTSLDSVLIRSKQYAAVVSAVLVDMANGDRSQSGLGTLTVNPKLVAAAQSKADDMAAKGYFAHISPQGIEPWHWFKVAGYDFTYAGENLALDFSDSRDVNTAWMNSPTHRANILDGHYTEIGIATAQGMYQGHLTTFVVQEFGTPSAPRSVRAAVQTETPTNPLQPATAQTSISTSTTTTNRVLGESVTRTTPKKILPPSAQHDAATVTNTTAAVVPTLPYPMMVAKVITSPRSMMHTMYYVIAAIIIVLLAVATEFEVHVRHKQKAYMAGALLTLVALLFLIGDRTLFVQPTISLTAASASAISR